MGEAILQGLLRSQIVSAERLWVSDIRPERLTALREKYGIKVCERNQELIKAVDVLILAIKPQSLAEVLQDIGQQVSSQQLVISIAAGIGLDFLQRFFPANTPLIRVMPNTPALIGEGVSALALGQFAGPEHEAVGRQIFGALGQVVVVAEQMMDGVTGLSGSGPAYVFLFLEALTDAGVRVGLSRDLALTMATQTVIGAARLVQVTGQHPAVLKDMVTSPGGTTIAGLHVLEEGKMRGTLISAVVAATERSKELSKK